MPAAGRRLILRSAARKSGGTRRRETHEDNRFGQPAAARQQTTFADEIACGLERRGREVGFINLDPQGGASHEQKTVEGEKAVTVVDTPGYPNDKLSGCVEVADIAIVPVEPSQRAFAR